MPVWPAARMLQQRHWPQAVWNMILMRAATITITTTGKAMTVTAIDAKSIHAIKHKLQRK
jgi:hypothetical protein